MNTDKSIPRVPDLHDPQPETPVTREFETGTANDPDVVLRTPDAGGKQIRKRGTGDD